MNIKTLVVIVLAALLVTGVGTTTAEPAYVQPLDCVADVSLMTVASAGMSFEQFQADAVLFFGDIDANVDTILSGEDGEQKYCDYLESHRSLFPANTPIYTYPYLGPAFSISPTEDGAAIAASPEQTPEPGQAVDAIPDRWWGLMQLIALMSGRSQRELASSSDPRYKLDQLMAEPSALARAYVDARLWDADAQDWKPDPSEALRITVVAESFGTAFARAFVVALAERMVEVGYPEADVVAALAGVHFIAIADVVPPFTHEADSRWTWLAYLPTLTVSHANEDFARFYGAQPYYEQYVPADRDGNLTEGVWPLGSERYLYVLPALDQPNVHGVNPAVLARDPFWLDLWESLSDGAPLSDALAAARER